jgi:RHS repeat-associated protein
MVDAITDPKGNPPTTYGYSSTYVGTYLTSVTNALNQTTTFTYDFNMGYLASTTDPNSQETTYSYNDKLGRLTTINYPDKGQTGYSYNDATPDPTVTTTKLATPDPTITSVTTFDGLGRARQTQITSVSPTITTYTTFDSLGRPYYVYNPTGCNPPTTNCGESTFGYSTYSYDALSRPLKITEQDGSTVTTTYSGSCSTVTDEASKTRETCTDGLERLNEVVENPGGLNYQTNYTYDVLNNLTGIVQYSSRPRGFIYDSLSRLTSSTNPESGTIAYTYDGDGNVQTRKDARGITTTYSYDALNRLKGKSYSDSTPATYFIYDTKIGWNVPQTNFIGRMTEAYTYPGGALVASIFSYDPLGRIVMNNQCDANTCPSGTGYSLTYSYDLAGNPLTEVNGYATNSYKYNGAAQPTTVTSSYVDANHPATLASNVTYLPTGQIGLMTYGNGLTGTYAANNRVQPCRYDTNSSAASLKLCTDATPSGSMLDFTYGYNWGSKDNGDVMSMSATGQQSFSRSYTYDQLDRLFTMSAPGDSCSGLSWGYDQWGNRTAQTTTGGTCSSSHLTYTAANQISNPGFTYDASGNVTHDANNSYFYDAENRIVQVNGTLPSCPTATACYVYDAFGRRDAKADVTGQFDYLYDLDGKVVAEWDIIPGYNGWGAFYVYLDGRLLVLYSNDTVYFAHSDSLGSTRLMTTLTKTKYDSMDYLPFGEQIEGDTGTTHKFTGMERDSETTSNLDNFEARYMESTLGRFMSPDPSGIWLADATDPKQLNLYNYVANNPLSNTDPSGLCTVFVGGVRDQNSGALAAAAASVGGLVVAPFGGQSTLGALLNIAAEALAGPNASSQQVSDALNSILSDPAGIQIVAFSGGAQAFSTAVESGSVGNVTSAPLSLVNTVVYLSPGLGPGGQLAFGSTAAVYHSTGVVDALATSFSRVSGQAGTALPGASGHSLQSEWNALMAGINAGTINLPAPFSPCLPIWKQPLPLIQRPPLPQLTGPGWDTLQGFPCVPLEGNPNGCSSY